MPIDLDTSLILSGADFGFQHGVYPPSLKRVSLSRVYRKAQDTPFANKIHVLLCFRRGRNYPDISEVRSKAFLPNGGVARMCSDKLGTFGVYRVVDPQNASLMYWVDFDHWPVTWDDNKNSAQRIQGLDRGHRHEYPNTANQKPALAEDAVLYSALILTGRV
jgi:hypothetical protein